MSSYQKNYKICVLDIIQRVVKGVKCAYWRTYEKFIGEGKTGRDFDLYCAKHGSYGPWRHEADPETYLYRGRDEDGKLPYLLYE